MARQLRLLDGGPKPICRYPLRLSTFSTYRLRAVYMYIDDKAGNVVAGLGYLREGEATIVYLDVLHELTHIRQWHAGRALWDRRYNYVDRPTEIEAYKVAVDEARRLGMTDREIAEYLRVEWTSREEHERLCKHLGVRSPESRAV